MPKTGLDTRSFRKVEDGITSRSSSQYTVVADEREQMPSSDQQVDTLLAMLSKHEHKA